MPEAAWNFQWRWNFFRTHGEVPINEIIPIADADDQETRRRVHEYNARVQHHLAQVEEQRRRIGENHLRFKQALLRLLSEENRQLLERDGHILVTGSLGGRYRISASGHSGNVTILSNGRRLCIHPYVYDKGFAMPVYGTMIAQLLMVVTDEQRFLRTAFSA